MSPRLLWLSLSLFLFLYVDGESPVTVNTSRGAVHGFHVDLGSDTSKLFYGKADVFLGIPYAKPPVGELRFKLPQPLCKFDKDIDAVAYKSHCPQKNSDQLNEDCLYLNIISPESITTTPYPVMVYIHGGSFTFEGADEYPWKGAIRNLVSRGVVVVTIQYRLGLLGFFTTFTSEFPANRGIYDQLLALQWVQEEIRTFGGDPGRVTIFGESAGASSVSALSLIPQSNGLFHQTIQESGSLLMEHDVPNDPRGSIHKARAKQICGISDEDWQNNADLSAILLECFKNRSLTDLTMHDKTDDLDWCVSRDGALIREEPAVLAASRPPLPAMIGNCKDEYAVFFKEIMSENISSVGPELLQRNFHKFVPWASESLKKELTSEMQRVFETKPMKEDDHLGWAQTASRAYTGLMFSAFLRRDAQWRREAGNENVFLFSFEHGSNVCGDTWVEGWEPIIHTSELCFLWFYPQYWEAAQNESRITPKDLAVADIMGKAWTDFAKNGNPGWVQSNDDYNFVAINSVMEVKPGKWRDAEHILYNIVFPDRLGQYPWTKIPEETDNKLKATGDKILSEWDRLRRSCQEGSSTSSLPFQSTSASAIVSSTETAQPQSTTNGAKRNVQWKGIRTNSRRNGQADEHLSMQMNASETRDRKKVGDDSQAVVPSKQLALAETVREVHSEFIGVPSTPAQRESYFKDLRWLVPTLDSIVGEQPFRVIGRLLLPMPSRASNMVHAVDDMFTILKEERLRFKQYAGFEFHDCQLDTDVHAQTAIGDFPGNAGRLSGLVGRLISESAEFICSSNKSECDLINSFENSGSMIIQMNDEDTWKHLIGLCPSLPVYENELAFLVNTNEIALLEERITTSFGKMILCKKFYPTEAEYSFLGALFQWNCSCQCPVCGIGKIRADPRWNLLYEIEAILVSALEERMGQEEMISLEEMGEVKNHGIESIVYHYIQRIAFHDSLNARMRKKGRKNVLLWIGEIGKTRIGDRHFIHASYIPHDGDVTRNEHVIRMLKERYSDMNKRRLLSNEDFVETQKAEFDADRDEYLGEECLCCFETCGIWVHLPCGHRVCALCWNNLKDIRLTFPMQNRCPTCRLALQQEEGVVVSYDNKLISPLHYYFDQDILNVRCVLDLVVQSVQQKEERALLVVNDYLTVPLAAEFATKGVSAVVIEEVYQDYSGYDQSVLVCAANKFNGDVPPVDRIIFDCPIPTTSLDRSISWSLTLLPQGDRAGKPLKVSTFYYLRTFEEIYKDRLSMAQPENTNRME